MATKYQDLRYYEKNFALLKERFPSTAALITPQLYEGIEIIKTKSEGVTASFHDILLHSKYDPQKEGAAFPLLNNIQRGDIILLYGFGLGYHLLPLLEAISPSGELYVIDLNQEILSTAFSVLDLTPLLSHKNFHLITGAEEMEIARSLSELMSAVFKNTSAAKKKIIIHQPSFKCIPPAFTRIKNALELLSVGKETTFVFKDIMVQNLQKNLDIVLANPGIKTLYGSLKRKPAWFIGAGPSLDTLLPLVKQYEDKAYVACVDTAFPILTNYGIAVDFVITVDPQPDSFRHFKNNLGTTKTVLIFTPTAYSAIVSQFKGPKLVVIKKDQALLAPVEMDLLPKGVTVGGGSVSCIGLDILMNLKANPIILAGMDFSFPHMKAYSANATDTKHFVPKVNKFNTLELFHRAMIEKKPLVYLPNKEGTAVVSHQNLYSYVKNIEQIVRLNPQIECLNFISQGVDIKGVTNIYFEEELGSKLTKKIQKHIVVPDDLPPDVDLKEKIIAEILLK